jgi:hypothetical protein
VVLLAALLVGCAVALFAEDPPREPEPDADAVAAAIKDLRQRKRSSFQRAQTRRGKRELAQSLVATAGSFDPEPRYAMLSEARRLAVEAGHVELAMKAMANTVAAFDVDALRLRGRTVAELADEIETPDERRQLAGVLFPMVVEAVHQERIEGARAIARIAGRLVIPLRDEALTKQAKASADLVERAAAEIASIEKARRHLTGEPKDPDASFVVAMDNLKRNKLGQAVTLFANCSQFPQLQALAKRDLAGATEVDQFIELATAWKKLADSNDKLQRVDKRAHYWCHRAIPKLSGERRASLEKMARGIQERMQSTSIVLQAVATAPANKTPGDAAQTSAVVAAPTLRKRWKAHEGAVNAIVYSASKPWLATGSADNTAVVWDASTAKRMKTLKGHTGAVHSVRFIDKPATVVSASADKTLRLWSLDGDGSVAMNGHESQVRDVVVGDRGRSLISCGDDRRVFVWDLSTRRSRPAQGNQGIVYGLALSPKRDRLATVGEDGVARVVDLKTGASVALTGHLKPLLGVAFSRDGQHLAAGGEDSQVSLWRLRTGQRTVLKGHSRRVQAIAFAPKQDLMASVGAGRQVILWDVRTGKQLASLEAHRDEVMCVTFSPDGGTLATGCKDGEVILWSLPTR